MQVLGAEEVPTGHSRTQGCWWIVQGCCMWCCCAGVHMACVVLMLSSWLGEMDLAMWALTPMTECGWYM